MVARPEETMPDDYEGASPKRQKLVHEEGDVDTKKPIFLKLNFKKSTSTVVVDEPDPMIEDDATYYARPWEEVDETIPSLLAFKMQFSEFFADVPDVGPQDLEEDMMQLPLAGENLMRVVCRMLTLALNRAKPVEWPNYGRAIGECVALHYEKRGHPDWHGHNPLGANRRFNDLDPYERIQIINCLIDWTLTDSKLVRERIEEAYKNRTTSKTINPYEVHSIGQDDKKHTYYLMKGYDTRFRLFVQTDLTKSPTRWYSVCDTLEGIRQYTSKLSDAAKTVRCRKIVDDLASIHIPEIERAEAQMAAIASRRQRTEYERARRAAIAAQIDHEPPPERMGRTRGHRVDYNSMLEGRSDEEDRSSRRSNGRGAVSDIHQITRSGRNPKRPRDWDDETLDRSYSVHDSIAASMQEESEEESEIVVLKYNKEKYRATLNEHAIESDRTDSPAAISKPSTATTAVEVLVDDTVQVPPSSPASQLDTTTKVLQLPPTFGEIEDKNFKATRVDPQLLSDTPVVASNAQGAYTTLHDR